MKTHIIGVAVLGFCLVAASAVSIRSRYQGDSVATNGINITDSLNQLFTTANQVQRINILDKDSDFVFDFFNPPSNNDQAEGVTTGKGGHTVAATLANFPALFGNDVAMTVGFIGPCGLNTPHTHPRATEINYIVNGSFTVGMIAENGARAVENTLYAGQMTVFPKGSIHWEANLGCQPVMFVAAFNNADPGVLQVAQNFFNITSDILRATLGGVSSSTLNSLKGAIPDNVANGLQRCLNQCNIS